MSTARRGHHKHSSTMGVIKTGDRFRMSDGTVVVVTKKFKDDHYNFDYYEPGQGKVGVPAWRISGDIVRAQDAGFRSRLPRAGRLCRGCGNVFTGNLLHECRGGI